MTGEQLMVNYLKGKIDKEFTQLDIQRDLDKYQENFNKKFLPESLSRYFRSVRHKKLLEKDGLEIVEVAGRKHLTFIIVPIELKLFY